MALSQMTSGNCFEDSDDLGWFGLFLTLRALTASLVAFKNSNITARVFCRGTENKLLISDEIMKCRWPTILESAMRSLNMLKDEK